MSNQARPSNNTSLVPVGNNQDSGSSSNSSDNQPSSNNSNARLHEFLQETRQPSNLIDLLNISTALSSSNESTPVQLTEERKEILRNALGGMTNFGAEMQKSLEILKETQTKPGKFIVANLNKYESALEELYEYLDDINFAQIFYQINGLSVVVPLLQSKHASLRSRSAAVILECCKNNPFCQERSVADEILGPLIEMATSDPNKDAMLNAVAAISAITRCNPVGIMQFNKFNGLHMLEKALNSGNEKIVNRAIFLVMALCDTDDDLKRGLTDSGIILTLITLLRLSDFIVKEYVLRALISVTRDNSKALEICRQHDLQSYLRSLCQSRTEPEYQEMVECANTLLERL